MKQQKKRPSFKDTCEMFLRQKEVKEEKVIPFPTQPISPMVDRMFR